MTRNEHMLMKSIKYIALCCMLSAACPFFECLADQPRGEIEADNL